MIHDHNKILLVVSGHVMLEINEYGVVVAIMSEEGIWENVLVKPDDARAATAVFDQLTNFIAAAIHAEAVAHREELDGLVLQEKESDQKVRGSE